MFRRAAAWALELWRDGEDASAAISPRPGGVSPGQILWIENPNFMVVPSPADMVVGQPAVSQTVVGVLDLSHMIMSDQIQKTEQYKVTHASEWTPEDQAALEARIERMRAEFGHDRKPV